MMAVPPDDTSTESLPENWPALQRVPTDQDHIHVHSLSDREHSRVRRLLYASHFLSAWNSRVFEFGAFLFLANIYTHTLLPASVYALARAASAAVFSPRLGSYIDRADRLRVVRLSIVGQRVAVAISCVGFFSMAQFHVIQEHRWSSIGFIAALSLLACIEKLSSVLNTISVERDWVVIVAASHEERLRLLNSQMRRIDLFCKLVGPLTISFVDSASPRIAIMVTGGMTAVSMLIEYFTIARVYNMVPDLREPKKQGLTRQRSTDAIWSRTKAFFSQTTAYVQHPAFLPSFSLALIYLTVLSFGGPMITYLTTLGISSETIGALRGVAAVFEMSATWIAPRIMSRIGPVRSGIWFLNWETVCVAVACVFFWLDESPTIAALGTVSAVIASRIGLWGFDLSAQVIVQEEVDEEHRGAFSSQEIALQNIFEMIAFASTIVFSRPDQFKYPATISAGAVGLAGVLYAMFVRSRRGHLLHLSRCVDRNAKPKDHHHWWTRVPYREVRTDDLVEEGQESRDYSTFARQSTGHTSPVRVDEG